MSICLRHIRGFCPFCPFCPRFQGVLRQHLGLQNTQTPRTFSILVCLCWTFGLHGKPRLMNKGFSRTSTLCTNLGLNMNPQEICWGQTNYYWPANPHLPVQFSTNHWLYYTLIVAFGVVNYSDDNLLKVWHPEPTLTWLHNILPGNSSSTSWYRCFSQKTNWMGLWWVVK